MHEPETSERIVALYEVTRPALAALREAVAPVAVKRPDRCMTEVLVAAARVLLDDVRKIVSREPGRHELLEISSPLTWAELHTKLLLAEVALGAFRQRYYLFSSAMRIHYWNTPTHLLAALAEPAATEDPLEALMRQVNDLAKSLG
jgi:hypothetical protein